MNPFDNVTIEIEKDNIAYTYGATIIATYTEDSTAMALISLVGSEELIRCEQSDLTAV